MTIQALFATRFARPSVAGRAARREIDVVAVAATGVVNLLLVAAVYGLTQWLPGWAAGVIVCAAVAAATVLTGASGGRPPVPRPRLALEEDVAWTKTWTTKTTS